MSRNIFVKLVIHNFALHFTFILVSLQGVCQRVGTLEALQEKSEHELRNILSERNAREEEVRRLNRALHNLKKYTGMY